MHHGALRGVRQRCLAGHVWTQSNTRTGQLSLSLSLSHQHFCVNHGGSCGVRGIGQIAKLPAARAVVRLTRAFGSGTVRQ